MNVQESLFRWFPLTNLFAVILFLIPGFILSLVFLPRVQALFASGLLASLIAIFSGIFHVWIDVPIHIVWMGLSAITLTVVLLIPFTRKVIRSNLYVSWTWVEICQIAVVLGLLMLVVLYPPAPLGWDARSIWLFHASWLNDSASAFIDAQHLPAIDWAHPDYPLLGAATIAVLWGMLGQGENLTLGLQVISLIAVFTAALSGSLAISALSKTGNRWINLTAFTLLIIAGFSVGGGLFNQAYMDTLQAFLIVCLISALLPTLIGRMNFNQAHFAGLVGISAMNVKQEGFWFSLVVILVSLVVTFYDQYASKYLPLVLVVGFFGMWKIFLESIHSAQQADVAGISDRLPELLHLDSTAWNILFRLIANEGFTSLGKVAVLITLFSIAILVSNPGKISIKLVSLLVGSWLLIIGVIFLTYALAQTRDKIDWWLATSYIRVISTPILIAWFIVFVAVITATQRLRIRTLEQSVREK